LKCNRAMNNVKDTVSNKLFNSMSKMNAHRRMSKSVQFQVAVRVQQDVISQIRQVPCAANVIERLGPAEL
jgi:hypothetical protein